MNGLIAVIALHVMLALAVASVIVVVVMNERKAPIAWMLTCGSCDRAPQPVTRLIRHEDGSWTFVNAQDYAVRTTEVCTAVESPIRK